MIGRGLLRRALVSAISFGLAVAPAMAHGPEGHGNEAREASPAPAAAPATTTQPPQEAGGATDAAQDDPQAEETSLATVMENLHPATVHFPIALFIVAALLELINAARPSARIAATVETLAIAGAAGAVIAAVFGWLHTGVWLGGDPAMHWHRWIGTGTALVGVAAGWFALRVGRNRAALRITLFALALAMAAQGYLGGELAHGPGHLTTTS